MKPAHSGRKPLVGGKTRFGLTLAVSLVFAFLFLRGLDAGEVVDSILAGDYELVPLALLLFAASLFVRAVRWRVFYEPDTPPVRLLFPVLLVTYAGNNILPLRAGELMRIQLLADRAGISRMRSIGTAILERLLDLLVLGSFVLAGRLIVDTGTAFLGIGLVFTFGGATGLVIAAVLARRPGAANILARKWPLVPLHWSVRLVSWAQSLIGGFSALLTVHRAVLAAALTGVAWLLELGMYWVVARAFGIDEGFAAVAFAGAAANLALFIPSAQGGFGPFQLAATEALHRFGVAGNLAAAYALALHVILVLPVSAVGLIVFWLMVPGRRFSARELTEER